MLKKMRWRFILAAMTAFFAIIVLVAALVNTVNYVVTSRRMDETLVRILDVEARIPGDTGSETPPPEPLMFFPDVESNYMTRFFIVRFEEYGNVLSTSTDFVASVDEADAVEYAQTALNKTADRGYLNGYRYVKEEMNGTTVIVFLNAARELQYMKSLFLLTIAVSLASLLLVFVLVVLFSEKAIRPIANNIKLQKQFITDASHELKTPLTSISTSVDVISMEHGEDEWTENIRNQTSRMSHLVNELVTLSRLDEDFPLLNREVFSLSNVAWEIAEIYQPQAKGEGKQFKTLIDDDVMLEGDRASIQRLLSVLLDNAIRYSDPNGEIRFSVSGKKNKARIKVFNTCDIDPLPDPERLFDRFYRPDSSRNSETGGTGVGLAIAKAVTEAHGGEIHASCPSGKTMTITVTL